MNVHARLKRAQLQAEQVIRDEEIKSLAVDVMEIAEKRGILVQGKPPTATGVSGMLVRAGDEFGILYATHISSIGFQRFSIAHELGHYFLEGHIDHVLPKDGTHVSEAGFTSSDPFELEADYFAASLLMPSALFQAELRKANDGLEAIETLSDKCITSLTATAIRYSELTRSAAAVIVSTGGYVNYCRLSESIKSLKGITWIRKGSIVPPETETASLNARPESIARAERRTAEIDIRSWLGGDRSVKAVEEVVGLGDYGRTLTILTCPSIEDEVFGYDVDDDEERLMESWTPRFHR
jgi:Zn-dependent peptidase ImmA (M78 family)